MATIKPLPPGSNKLRNGRWHVWVGEPHPTRSGWAQVDEGRFVSLDHAKQWADEQHPDAPRVNITRYAAWNGWQAQRGPTRQDGIWDA